MRLRAVIFDDDTSMRQVLWSLCNRRGYEVFTFPDPGLCPLHVMDRCPCAPGSVCADLILCDLNMPEVQGLDFVEALVAKRCTVPHLALMSGTWSEAAEVRAARLGCQLFRKPFGLAAIDAWLAKVETLVRPDRRLFLWDAGAWGRQPPAEDARP